MKRSFKIPKHKCANNYKMNLKEMRVQSRFIWITVWITVSFSRITLVYVILVTGLANTINIILRAQAV